jgi:anti-sigma factor RsiW
MRNKMDHALQEILRSGLDAELDDLPDPQVVWWRAYREERESLMARAVLPMTVLAAPLEAAASIAPALLLAIGASNGYLPPSVGWLAALVSAMLLGGCWVAARFPRPQSHRLLTAPASRSY